jgi:hypothetical protein
MIYCCVHRIYSSTPWPARPISHDSSINRSRPKSF